MTKSESIMQIAAALCLAQAEYPNIPRSKEVIVKSDKGSYKFSYAPFDHIVSAMRPILSKHGLAFSQCVNGDTLSTILMHTSGEYLCDSMPLRPGSTAQAYGSELTYKRRYSLASVLGLATEDDDDGKGADPEKKERKSTKVAAESYASLPEETQVSLAIEAKKIEADFFTKSTKDAFDRYTTLVKTMNEDEHLGLWNLLGSKVRSGIKEYGKASRQDAVQS